MKVQLIRKTDKLISADVPYKLVDILLSKEDLGIFLNYHLEVLMYDSDDPDLKGKKPDQYINNLLLNNLGDFDNRYIIGVEDEQLIGILIGIKKEDGLHITSVGTHPDYRRQGIGKVMLEKCRKDLYHRGIHVMYLDVHTENTPAISLYNQLEFIHKK